MALPPLGEHRDPGLPVGSILRAMASAAVPEGMDGRQRGMASTLQNMVTMGTSGDTPRHGQAIMGNNTPTLHMVWDAQQSIFSGQPTFSLRGGGGWQNWQTKKEVYKPSRDLFGNSEKKGRSLDDGKLRWWTPREGGLRQKPTGGVKDAGVGQPKGSGKRRLTFNNISNNLSSPAWRNKAVQKLRGKMFAKSTLASKASKRKKLSDVLAKVKGNEEDFFPLSPDELEVVGAVLSKLGLKAGEQYINEVKLMQLEAGFSWDEVMERQLARDAGPDKRAAEVKPDQVVLEDTDVEPPAAEGKPAYPKVSYVFATVWMLRSGEVSSLEVKHLALDPANKVVALTIPKSKMDQGARGVKRSLACCGQKPCTSTCPWRISVRVKTRLAGKDEESPLIADANGSKVTRFHLVKSWTENLDPKMSGHSARRSGAMFYTRQVPDGRSAIASSMYLNTAELFQRPKNMISHQHEKHFLRDKG